MSLTIGQVSQLLNLSVETIRFYEKEKIISPSRKEGSSYRKYSVWDVYDLTDCIKYRNMEFSLKETRSMMQDRNLAEIKDNLNRKIEALKTEISNKQIILESIEEYREKIENASLNIGNYWFKTEREKWAFPCNKRVENEYEDLNYENKILTQWISNIPIVKIYMNIRVDDYYEDLDKNSWNYVIESRYGKILGLSKNEQSITIKPQLCLHTIIDIGDKQEFSIRMLKPIFEHIKEKKLEVESDILGELLIRYHENGKWHRLVEMIVPIKT